MVCPLSLSLKTTHDGIVSQRFFLEAHFQEFGVPAHQVAENHEHFDNVFPIGIQPFAVFLFCRDVEIFALIDLAVFFCPCQGFFVFCFVINAFINAADNFAHIHLFIAHAQIGLEEVGIHDTAGNTHGYITDRKVAFPPHGSNGNTCPCETQEFFLYIFGNGPVACILYVMPVNAESRHAFLAVSSQGCSKIYRPWAFRAVESPDGLGHPSVIVDGFAAIAPARRHGNNNPHAFFPELFSTSGSFRYPPDGGVGNDTLYGVSVAVF